MTDEIREKNKEVMEWLDNNRSATTEEIEHQHNEYKALTPTLQAPRQVEGRGPGPKIWPDSAHFR